MRLLTVCDRSGRKRGERGGWRAETGILRFRLLICDRELKVERKGEEREKKGFRMEGGGDKERVTGEGGEGRKEEGGEREKTGE